MASGRNPKRARQKDRQAARRAEYRREYLRRRRQRRSLLLGTLGALAVIVLVVLFVGHPFGLMKSKKSAASPAPTLPTKTLTPTSFTVPKKTPVACGASLPSAAGSTKKAYTKPEDQHLDPAKTYTWKLQTSCGEIDIALDVKNSPKTTNSIVFLTKQGFYDGTFFHRIAPGFVIQGGDAKGDGTGDAGYKVVEPVPSSFKYKKGTVAMAKGGTEAGGTSGSQFFIVISDGGAANLTPDYAEVGNVTTGSDVVDKIAATGTSDGPPDPSKGWTYIESATIVEG